MGDIKFITGNNEIGQISNRQYDMHWIYTTIKILITLKSCKDIVEDRYQ